MFHGRVVNNAEMLKSFLISNGVNVKSLYLVDELDAGDPVIKVTFNHCDTEPDFELVGDLLEEQVQCDLELTYHRRYSDNRYFAIYE